MGLSRAISMASSSYWGLLPFRPILLPIHRKPQRVLLITVPTGPRDPTVCIVATLPSLVFLQDFIVMAKDPASSAEIHCLLGTA